MLITSKRYVVTTEAINCYLFRVLTAGIDLTQYANNSILLFMHQRAMGIKTDEILPVGIAIDLKIEGDRITTKLGFDEKDEFAVKLYNKYEAGILNMLSPGLKPLEWSEEPDMMLPGQIGPTVTKSTLIEISCVDIGANPEAYAVALYDDTDKLIQLSAINEYLPTLLKQNADMKLITLKAPEIIAMLKLNADTATEQEVQNEVQRIITLSGTLATENETLKSNAKELTTKLFNAEVQIIGLKGVDDATKVKTLLDKAQADRKFLPAQRPHYETLANIDLAATEAMLNALPSNPAITLSTTTTTTTTGLPGEVETLAKLSWDELWKGGKLEKLKALDLNAFNAKFKEKYGKEPNA